ncbi:hypothetical protein BG011_001446 [Mortierella polycephala]|uniref:Uncharacterized protein n=1 Tax=Mortierella polycephala TaxID=41804 RepID=A0A9P6PLE4_9FUNG|nr:hypothetical protein BG011_001446 [Mortierella polycephala]
MHDLNPRVFERLTRRATRVICLDADLSNEEIEIMKSLRSDFIVINNTFQQQKDDKVVLFDEKMKLMAEVYDMLRAGKRLWISSTMSAPRTEALHAMLTKAGFKGECVTKDTSEAMKQDTAKNINIALADLDYFIHTPTISVGIDYNVKDHVDYVVGIFSTHSTVDVETCIQMMRRVGHVKSKTYLVYADACIDNNLPTTAPEIKNWICNQLDLVTGKVKVSSALKLELDDDNELVIPDDLYHRLYCHVTAKKHLSMNGFRSRFIQRMTGAGCVVTGNGGSPPDDHPTMDSLREAEKNATSALHQAIADADPISPDEFERLSRGAQELSAEQRASVYKFAVMQTYDVQEHSIVTEEWVKKYDNRHEKECYKNLKALSRSCGASLQSCLKVVRQHEELGLDYSLRGATSAEAHSKLERSQFVKLEYVVDILETCGFMDAFATNEVLAEDLKSRIDGVWSGLESKMSQICTTLKKKRPMHNNWTFKNKLTFINTVLFPVIGATIATPILNKRITKYHLVHGSSVGSDPHSPLTQRLRREQ